MSLLKTKSIVTAGVSSSGVYTSFTLASVATYLAQAATPIEPLMNYLVNGEEYFAQPNQAGAYTAKSGAKYDLVPVGAAFAQMKVGNATHNLTKAANIVEAEGSGIATVSLTDGKFVFGATSGTATNGQRLAADGSGGFVFVDDATYTGSNTDTVNTTIDGSGVVSSALNIKQVTNQALVKDASGAYVLLVGKTGDAVTTSYDAATGELAAILNVSTDGGNIFEKRANGAYVGGLTIASASTPYATIANNVLTVTPLTIKSVKVQATGDLDAAYLTANYSTGLELQEGDMVMFPAVAKTFVHNGGTTGTIADFTQVQTPSMTTAQIRATLSASNGVQFDPLTGIFTGVVAAGNTGLTVGVDGFNFAYQNQAVIDASGIMNLGVNASTNLHALLQTTGNYAKKMWDTTATYFYMSGTYYDGSAFTKKFYMDGDGHLVYDLYTGGSDFSTSSISLPSGF